MFKLYAGMKINDVWYKKTEIDNIKGGVQALIDVPNKSGVSRLLSLIKAGVKKLFSDNDDEYILEDKDYLNIIMEDAWKIGYEIMKYLKRTDKLIFSEYFFCDVCSNIGTERYTQVNECWDTLIDDFIIDEYYLDNYDDLFFETVLPNGIEIETNKSFQGGVFNKIVRKPLTLGDLIGLPDHRTEADLICNIWDKQIVSICGMDDRMFQIYVKRSQKDSFTKKYIVFQDDMEEMMSSNLQLGWDAQHREVKCQYCGNEIGGTLDFSNFFSPLLVKKSNQIGRGV